MEMGVRIRRPPTALMRVWTTVGKLINVVLKRLIQKPANNTSEVGTVLKTYRKEPNPSGWFQEIGTNRVLLGGEKWGRGR